MRVLVTGANGFIGSALVKHLSLQPDFAVRAAVRAMPARGVAAVNYQAVGAVDGATRWSEALEDIQVVVHLAARAHVMNDDPVRAVQLFREVNVDGAVALAQQALEAGVKRFVFVSSIGVNGNVSQAPFSESSPARPHAPYAESKYQAEQALTELFKDTATELVIVRPPLVYDAQAPGNFRRLLTLVRNGIPVPLGMIGNHRSMISRDNLVEILTLCVEHPAAANELFLVADGEDLSTGEIVKVLGQGMGRSVLLVPVPAVFLRWAATLTGRRNMYTQLCESLQVDACKLRNVLGWRPRVSTRDQLQAVGRAFLAGQ